MSNTEYVIKFDPENSTCEIDGENYIPERTCKPIYWNNAFGAAFARGRCSKCDGYLLETSKHNPLPYCPHCGAKVVE